MDVYKKANIEIPEMIVKRIEEVNSFYLNVIEDRINNINNRISEIDKEIVELCIKRDSLINDMNEIGIKLSNNNIYESALDMIQKLNESYSEYKYRQGQLTQIKDVYSQIKDKEDRKAILFSNISKIVKQYENQLNY